jgi:HemK-related putative methylase
MVFPNLTYNPWVYPPQEDTWFMVDVLEDVLNRDKVIHSQSFLVCEIGVGSGFISIVLAKKFPMIHFIGTDISFQASRLSYKNMSDHLICNQYDLICMDLLQSFNPLKFHPDIIFFNPPYVRSSLEEINMGYLEKSWAGGPKGISVIHEFLKELSRFSFKKAIFLSSHENENEQLERDFNNAFQFHVISQRKIENERLICYEIRKK